MMSQRAVYAINDLTQSEPTTTSYLVRKWRLSDLKIAHGEAFPGVPRGGQSETYQPYQIQSAEASREAGLDIIINLSNPAVFVIRMSNIDDSRAPL